MKDLVKTQDLIDFYTQSIENVKIKCAKSRQLYEQHKIEYESGFFAKLFGWKYENVHWSYDHYWESTWLESLNAKLGRTLYYQKLGNVLLYIDDEEWRVDEFFKWCKNNNRPQ